LSMMVVPMLALEMRSDQPRHRVGLPARRERHDHLDDAAGIGLGECRGSGAA